jgi:hypothetical protein
MSNVTTYTVSKALDDLNEMGFTYDFNIHEDDIVKIQAIMKFNIFIDTEGDSNPDDEATVYGIKSTWVKGVFVADMQQIPKTVPQEF